MTVTAPEDVLPKLDKFEICEEIGHGGMATVYRAKDLRLGRDVAVKIIHRHLRDNPEVATRFVSEARAAAKLKHRGIVEVYDVSAEEDREKFLVVELIRGCTLRKTLVEHRDMPAEVGAAIVAELCDAVEHAHAAGIIHRDIKPENVLIELPSDRKKAARGDDADLDAKSGTTPVGLRVVSGDAESAEGDADGEDAVSAKPSASTEGAAHRSAVRASADRPSTRSRDRRSEDAKEPARPSDPTPSRSPKSGRDERDVTIKLTDFGIAKVLDAQGVTSTGQVLGSPAHMAPEQIEGGDIDPRTDVFALGVLLYECMVGHLPFEGKNPAQVLRRVIEGEFSPADLERPSVGGRFAHVVAAALANKPEERLESPQALGEELRRELAELGLGDPRAEIAAYFLDPDKYAAELPGRIVPKLVARGEAHRRARRVQLAASDFNRAHALSPEDPAILKRITSLSASAGRERMLRRGALLGALALGLSGLTYGVVRAVRTQAAKTAATSSAKAPSERERPPAPVVRATDEAPSQPLVSPSVMLAKAKAVPTQIVMKPIEPAVTTPRRVTIGISPMGAILELDGAGVDPLGKTFSLAPGPHAFTLRPPTGSDCCEVRAGRIDVLPAAKDKPDEIQKVALALDLRPALVRIAGGPPGAMVACGPFSFTATQQEVKLTAADQPITCTFQLDSGAVKKTFNLKAGVSNSIPWPSGG